MSDYKRDGAWDVTWDALFYRFISRASGVEYYKRNLTNITPGKLKDYMRIGGEFIGAAFR